MFHPYILGAFFASVLGFLLYALRDKERKDNRHRHHRADGLVTSSSEIGQCRQDDGFGTDIIIVGAGVAGSALAHTLGKVLHSRVIGLRNFCQFRKRVMMELGESCDAFNGSSSGGYNKSLCSYNDKDGRRVHIIERDLTEPDRIVGELLQPGGYLKLIELGLEDCVEEIDAQRVLGYALFKDGKNTRLSYPLEKFHSDVAGRSFHNGRFIQRMREKAASLSNVRMEQGTVTSLLEENGTIKGVQYKTKAGQELKAYAPLTIVCDGCFSNLRRSLCNPKVDVPSCFVGLVLENCQLPFANHGHLPSIANGEMANHLKTRVAPQLPPQLYDAFISAIDQGKIRTMPNRSMPADPYPTPGALLMGKVSCIYMLLPVASTINTLAGALYKVFCASPDQARKEMREACFDYLSLGGVCSAGPVALLSGLNPRPLSLVVHFFAVAIYGVGRLLLPFPSLKRLWIGARLISAASSIIFPIIKAEGVRQMFFPVTMPAYYRAPPAK
ncbi:Squalene monooxygenase [Vitis vinifera]|uniref:Squalene monooxygenase n=1 Tax=Vitis vinifera TaxID=29760 RepID=A0A438FC67_VITVI|nr:Squalene monooxygenase [Vitis vinifera]